MLEKQVHASECWLTACHLTARGEFSIKILILCLRPAHERRRYFVNLSLAGRKSRISPVTVPTDIGAPRSAELSAGKYWIQN